MNDLKETGRPKGMRNYLGIYGAMWRNSVVREMSFKFNFILWIFVEILWFAMQLVFINVLYLHTDSIGSWTKWQVVMLVGGSHFIQQMFQAFFFTNVAELSESIRTGRLDFMLLLPVNTRFLISLRKVDLGGFVNGTASLAVMVYAAQQMNYVPGLGQILGFGALAVVGVLVHLSLLTMLACVSFWTVQAQGIVWGYYNLFNIARLPDEAFRGVFKAVFTFVLPMLLVSNVPVKVLINKLSTPWEWLPLVGLGIVIFWVSEMLWRYALSKYTSASS
jgi:ABC-2 type transport system permease protein